jgi:hypothetical protein
MILSYNSKEARNKMLSSRFSISEEDAPKRTQRHVIMAFFSKTHVRNYVLEKGDVDSKEPFPLVVGDRLVRIKRKGEKKSTNSENAISIEASMILDGTYSDPNNNNADRNERIVIRWDHRPIKQSLITSMENASGAMEGIKALIDFGIRNTGENIDHLDYLDYMFILKCSLGQASSRVLMDTLCVKYFPKKFLEEYGIDGESIPISKSMTADDIGHEDVMLLCEPNGSQTNENNKNTHDHSDEDFSRRPTIYGYIYYVGVCIMYAPKNGCNAVKNGCNAAKKCASDTCFYCCCLCCCSK